MCLVKSGTEDATLGGKNMKLWENTLSAEAWNMCVGCSMFKVAGD